jgi:hypothetical protein
MSDNEFAAVYNDVERYKTIAAVAAKLGIAKKTVKNKAADFRKRRLAGAHVPELISRAISVNGEDKPEIGGVIHYRPAVEVDVTPRGGVKRFIVTSAQNNTYLHEAAWNNLLALAKEYGARMLVSRHSYVKKLHGSEVKPDTDKSSDSERQWYDDRIKPFVCDERVRLAPGLVFCGEMNILPTATQPLSGLATYTGRDSGIFPHPKLAMESIPSGRFEGTKFNFTTGTVTQRNYIAKKTGLKAEFHHTYGGLLVEVDRNGDWWVRQLMARDSDGAICDLDLLATGGKIVRNQTIEAITWGDIHVARLDKTNAKLAWFGRGSMIDVLKPKYQFMHDILDFRARNGHTFKKNLIHDRFAAYVEGHDSVEQEIRDVAAFLERTQRPFCKTVVVDSNHDEFMLEWLRIGDYRNDPVNAIYFLEAQLAVYKSIEENGGRGSMNMLKWAIERELKEEAEKYRFLNLDEQFIISRDVVPGGIDCGMHGHLGPNGARGTAWNIARMGRAANVGHHHSAGIYDMVWVSGITGEMDQGYNRGPGSWSATHILNYGIGTRSMVTCWNSKWRA